MAYTKKDLIHDLYLMQPNVTKKQIEEMLRNLATIVRDQLTPLGETIEIPGICRIGLKERQTRNGRNPKTGEMLTIPGKWVCVIKPVKALRDKALRNATSDFDPA